MYLTNSCSPKNPVIFDIFSLNFRNILYSLVKKFDRLHKCTEEVEIGLVLSSISRTVLTALSFLKG